jgi:hypothetical protein
MSNIHEFIEPELGVFATISQVSDWLGKRGICIAGNQGPSLKKTFFKMRKIGHYKWLVGGYFLFMITKIVG